MNVADPASQTVVVVFVIPPVPVSPVALLTDAVVVEIGEADAVMPVGNVTVEDVVEILPPDSEADASADIDVPAVSVTAPDAA